MHIIIPCFMCTANFYKCLTAKFSNFILFFKIGVVLSKRERDDFLSLGSVAANRSSTLARPTSSDTSWPWGHGQLLYPWEVPWPHTASRGLYWPRGCLSMTCQIVARRGRSSAGGEGRGGCPFGLQTAHEAWTNGSGYWAKNPTLPCTDFLKTWVDFFM